MDMLARVDDSMLLREVIASVLHDVEALVPDCYCTLLLADNDQVMSPATRFRAALEDRAAGFEVSAPAARAEVSFVRLRNEGVAASGVDLECWDMPRTREGYQLCWSEPVLSAQGDVLGLLALYSPSHYVPEHHVLARMRSAAEFASFAIEHRSPEMRARKPGNFDPLTGLPNRLNLAEQVRNAIRAAERIDGILAVLLLDLDYFKDINDTFGHSVGDALLISLAARIEDVVDGTAIVSRLGGDEFIVLHPAAHVDDAKQVAGKILDAVAAPWQFDQNDLRITGSIGMALYPDHGADLETLLRSADAAMYLAKAEGRGNYQFFTEDLRTRSQRQLRVMSGLRCALDNREFSVGYQPQVSLHDGKVVGVEALLRWSSPRLGKVSPSEFVPLAENAGMIVRLGEWVLAQAMQDARRWVSDAGKNFFLSVNLSAAQFRCPELVDRVVAIALRCGFPTHRLVLELTESAAMSDSDAAVIVMDRLRVHGIRVAIDDFGTGYSSLAYLKKFNACKLKIDQSFIHGLPRDGDDKAIVRAILLMARSLGMITLAEGVETEAQVAYLQSEGCDEIQGFYVGKPISAAEFSTYVGG
jgi:diguanylate cyclase (GGDEF)-like protein